MCHDLRWFLRLLRVSISHASAIPNLAKSPEYYLDLSSFRCMVSISLNLRVFCLHGQALWAIGLTFAYGLAITLNIAIRCDIAIILKFVHCTLVACSVKYILLLVITLSVVIRCNTAIRPESICCTLITCGQVFVCFSTTTLVIVVLCDTTIRQEFVRCVLPVIRLLPIYLVHLR